MVHSIDFAKNYQAQHALGQQNIKRKFCGEEEAVKQDYFIKRRYIRPIKRVIKKTNEPAFFPNTGAYGYCYAISKPDENAMMIV